MSASTHPTLGSLTHPDPHREEGRQEEGVGELGRYRVKGPAALPDAVCVDHVEDAAEDSRVCNEKVWCWQGMAERSLQRAQLRVHREYSEFPTQGFVQPSQIKEKSEVPCVSPMSPCPALGMLSPSFQRPM